MLSPSTAALDRGDKRKVYQRERVPWFRIVEPRGSTLEVLKLDGPTYRLVDVFAGEAKVELRADAVVDVTRPGPNEGLGLRIVYTDDGPTRTTR